MRIEDAAAIPRYALDLYLAPVRASLRPGGAQWSARPGVAYGLVPRTQIEIAFPVTFSGASGAQRLALSGVDLAAQYTFNAETRTLPSLALESRMLVPVTTTGVANAHPSVKALVTRTFDWGRLHANAETTFGREPAASARDLPDLSRWMAGVAVDRALPARAILLGVEAYARQPVEPASVAQWHVGAALRYQLGTRTSLDAAVSRAVSGPDRPWVVSLGVARRVALRSVWPGRGAWNGQ